VSADNIADRAAGFGMPGVIVDGFDVFAVYEVADEAIRRAREGGGPTLLEVKFTRYYGHFEGDQQTYRGKDEIQNAKENLDCLQRFRKRVADSGRLTDAQLDEVDAQVAQLIEEAVTEAKAAPVPGPEDLVTDVYVKY
jgi:pyruvate dehydrogenase E1 component alpha subunit